MTNKKQLNKEQEEAVKHSKGPLLVVAGAGTGKTTILIERLHHIIKNNLAKPDEILITTFTEKAAGEMEERADKILPYGYTDLWINTFHSFCERILRDHAIDIGLPSDFKLLSETEQWMLIRKNLDKFDLDYYKPLGNPTKFIHELLKHFSRLKDENILALDYLNYAESLEQNKDAMLSGMDSAEQDLEIKRIKELAEAYHVYNQLLLDNSSFDFGDLIVYTIKLFKERANILKFYQEKFKFIMVDEFQDTNYSQYELIKILAEPKNNLMVVGDDDQSIYAFRGSSMHNIMQFGDDYKNARKIVLTKNYRSGQEILDLSYDFIKHNNPNRLEVKLGIKKQLISPLQKKAKIFYNHYQSEQEELEQVANQILSLYEKNKEVAWSDFAILTRSNDTANKFVNILGTKNIPNQFVSLRGLYLKPIIVDIISYFKLLDNYHESSALFRVLNMDVFRVSYADIVNINKFARRKAWSMYEALYNLSAIPNLEEKTRKNIDFLLSLIRKHSAMVKNFVPSKIYVRFVYDSGLLKDLDTDKDREIFDYLNQFYQKIQKFENDDNSLRLKDLMEALEMEAEAGETGALKLDLDDADIVKIMTVHGAKGLEFDYVFLPALVDKKFPVINRKEKITIPEDLIKEKLPEGDAHIEEERKLFYVALTRAKKELFLSSASDYGGAREKKPSKFIEELGLKAQSIKKEKKKTDNQFLQDLKAIEKKKKRAIKYELPKKYSFSQLAAYKSCPLQYKFNFILKIPVEEKYNFVFGKVMHNTLKDFFALTITDNGSQKSLFGEEKKTKPSLESLLDLYEKNWKDDGYKSKKDREEYYKKGKEICKGFYERLEQDGWPKVIFVEKNFNVKIGGYSLHGGIDRIDLLPDGTVEIIDYKTGAPKQKLDTSYKKQLMIYQLATEQSLGLKVSRLTNYYLEDNSTLSFTAKEKDLEKLSLEIITQIQEIQKQNFQAKPSLLCKYCDFRGICEFRK